MELLGRNKNSSKICSSFLLIERARVLASAVAVVFEQLYQNCSLCKNELLLTDNPCSNQLWRLLFFHNERKMFFVDLCARLRFSYYAYLAQKYFPLKNLHLTSLMHSFWTLGYERVSDFCLFLRIKAQVL